MTIINRIELNINYELRYIVISYKLAHCSQNGVHGIKHFTQAHGKIQNEYKSPPYV
jgi:hypothetical protein